MQCLEIFNPFHAKGFLMFSGSIERVLKLVKRFFEALMKFVQALIFPFGEKLSEKKFNQ